MSHDLPTLIGFRVLQGVGLAGLVSVSTALLRFIQPTARLGRALGLYAVTVGASMSAAPAAAEVAAGMALGACLLHTQRLRVAPLVPVDLLRIKLFGLSTLTGIGAYATLSLSFVALPFFFQGALGLALGLLLVILPAGAGNADVAWRAALAGMGFGFSRRRTTAP